VFKNYLFQDSNELTDNFQCSPFYYLAFYSSWQDGS
jgi:hypothetical protein